jgi:hypothetical protein
MTLSDKEAIISRFVDLYRGWSRGKLKKGGQRMGEGKDEDGRLANWP